jgi:biotin transport system substrate-specific component
MQKELASPIRFSAAPAGVSSWMRMGGVVVFGSLFLALCARVTLPLNFTPVPLSLQPLGVLLLGLLLSPALAAGTVAAYLLEGACGLPVFAPTLSGSTGLAHLLGPTGGYLMAYPAAACLISWLWRKTGRRFSTGLASAAAGDLLILGSGALWLAASTHLSAIPAGSAALLAFLPGDALKIVAAAAVAAGWQRVRLRSER